MAHAAAIATHIGAVCEGDEDRDVVGVASLKSAGPTDLSFCANTRWADALPATKAGVVILKPGVDVPPGCTALRHPEPRLGYALAAAYLLPLEWPAPGVHPTACVDPSSVVDGASIGPFAVIGAHTFVAPGAWIGAHAVVGAHCNIGAKSRLMPHAVVMERCVIGDRVWLQPGAVIGADGFGHVVTPQGVVRVPQFGTVVLESDVEVGANACVDRAALDETRIGKGSRLDNLVQVAHGVHIGAHCLLAAFAGVAGGARLGRGVVMAGRTAVVDGIEVGDNVMFAGLASARQDVPADTRLGGSPARRYRRWLREVAAVRQLPEALRTLERIRRELEQERG